MDYVTYFQNKTGFSRFFMKCLEKYQRSGKVVGNVKMENITKEEALAFTNFFGRKFYPEKDYVLSIKEFLKILQKGRFSNFDFETYFMEIYKNFTRETNKEKKLRKKEIYYQYLENILKKMACSKLKEIFNNIYLTNTTTMQYIKRKYLKNSISLERELLDIDKLLNNIPTKVTYLPIYASLTGNPHYLDFSSSTSNLFYRFLALYLDEEIPKNNEEKSKLLEKINVYTDPLSNFVIAYNLIYPFEIPFKTMNLNIENIQALERVKGTKNQIFIFENPSILNHLKNLSLDISVIITSGNINLAFYKLLEKIDENTILYYHGDYDPEGLLIAQKLLKKYPDIVLIGYKKENYIQTKPTKIISKKRLQKLEHIKVNELKEIKECLMEYKKAGYEEKELEFILRYVKNML